MQHCLAGLYMFCVAVFANFVYVLVVLLLIVTFTSVSVMLLQLQILQASDAVDDVMTEVPEHDEVC